MSSLFKYPKIKHIRKQSPPDSKNYHKFKPFLQKEFRHRCIYCMLPDTLPRSDSFGVDHYRPKKLFPELTTVYSNLFYACNCCNRRKSNFWPNTIQLKNGQFIPNPCENVMFDHLKYDAYFVKHQSQTGQFTIDLLDLNDDKSIDYRSLVFDLINSISNSIDKIDETISQLDELILATDKSEKTDFLEKKKNHLLEKSKLTETYKKLTGN